jgi:hypothetical protein
MVFENDIKSLGRQGLTSGTIANRLGLSPNYVRSVLNTACVAEIKPLYDPVLGEWRKQQAAQAAADRLAERARQVKATVKRDKAQRALEAAAAELAELNGL